MDIPKQGVGKAPEKGNVKIPAKKKKVRIITKTKTVAKMTEVEKPMWMSTGMIGAAVTGAARSHSPARGYRGAGQ